MTVTVLVPVYGVEKYIGECAKSLFAQTYTNIEYIFCNDCTPDRSIEILHEVLEQFPDRKGQVKIINQSVNKGSGAARLRLTREVHTETFMMVDSDDILPLNAVEVLVKRMQETNKDIIDGAFADYYNGEISQPKHRTHCSDDKFLRRVLCVNLETHCVWGRLYKSNLLQKLPDMFFEGIDNAEDYCATARISAIASRAWVDDVVYYYRKDHSGEYTDVLSDKNLLSMTKAAKEVLRFYRLRGHLPMAEEIGALNVYREYHKAHKDFAKADEILNYVPEHFRARLLYSLFRNEKLYSLGDCLYRIFRTITVL